MLIKLFGLHNIMPYKHSLLSKTLNNSFFRNDIEFNFVNILIYYNIMH
jgi:predicted oxidoreductase